MLNNFSLIACFPASMAYFLKILFLALLLVPVSIWACSTALFSLKRGAGISAWYNGFAMRSLGVEIEVEDANGPDFEYKNCVLTLLNQTSLLDGAVGILSLPRPLIGIANIEFALLPFYGWMIMIHSFVIIRQWPRQALRTVKRMESYLSAGGNVYVSIEGRRSADRQILPYKKGPVVMALNTEGHIVPVFYEKVGDALPYGSLRVRPTRVKVHLLKAISMKGRDYSERDEIVTGLESIARKMNENVLLSPFG
ncbi:MAG: lysophospholipid acyltransferase family protein [Candidatus Thiodiazotropha sp.]|nr:1-acyl-sn-glycerol-3-phosphate acyltransferase [Candidatus Thiodiazotropha taylori]